MSGLYPWLGKKKSQNSQAKCRSANRLVSRLRLFPPAFLLTRKPDHKRERPAGALVFVWRGQGSCRPSLASSPFGSSVHGAHGCRFSSSNRGTPSMNRVCGAKGEMAMVSASSLLGTPVTAGYRLAGRCWRDRGCLTACNPDHRQACDSKRACLVIDGWARRRCPAAKGKDQLNRR